MLKHPAIGLAVTETHASKVQFLQRMVRTMAVATPSAARRMRNDRGASSEREGVPVCVVDIQVGQGLVDAVPTRTQYGYHQLSLS